MFPSLQPGYHSPNTWGGEFEPVGDDFEDSSIHVPVGADEVTGVTEALPKDRLEMPPEEGAAEE